MSLILAVRMGECPERACCLATTADGLANAGANNTIGRAWTAADGQEASGQLSSQAWTGVDGVRLTHNPSVVGSSPTRPTKAPLTWKNVLSLVSVRPHPEAI
ncbi:hypothetical protein GCM10010468_35690 [Actinocorallia longicatena]|uniref:Uncharacterized protein n=1 Tax=Actinocorallia longicatena TaxID=111803 RepID=A0ABP6QDP7_9ACTN